MKGRRKRAHARRRNCLHHDPTTGRSFVASRSAEVIACSECGQSWPAPVNDFYEDDEPVEELLTILKSDGSHLTAPCRGIRIEATPIGPRIGTYQQENF